MWEVDMSVSFHADDSASASLMSRYSGRICKAKCCLVLCVVQGTFEIIINSSDYHASSNDLIFILPEVQFEVKAVSADLLLTYTGFSSKIINNVNLWNFLSPIAAEVILHPMFSLDARLGVFFRDYHSVMKRLCDVGGSLIGHHTIMSSFAVSVEVINMALRSKRLKGPRVRNSREQNIVSQFIHRATKEFRHHHKISHFAEQANVSLSHFCNVVSKTTGMTPQYIMRSLIIKEAKTQLKNTDLPVHDIGKLVGFATPSTFNRYFKNYTGMTPQEYRNNEVI